MAAKARLTVFAVAVLVPIFMVCVNLKAFWVATAFMMLYFSVKSLKNLIIVNFASDSFYEKHISEGSEFASAFAVLTDAILVCGAYALIMIMLFISFFMLGNPVMKVFSVCLLGLWAFDFHKVFSKPAEDEEWTSADTLKEAVMWLQSVGSIVFALVSSFML